MKEQALAGAFNRPPIAAAAKREGHLMLSNLDNGEVIAIGALFNVQVISEMRQWLPGGFMTTAYPCDEAADTQTAKRLKKVSVRPQK